MQTQHERARRRVCKIDRPPRPQWTAEVRNPRVVRRVLARPSAIPRAFFGLFVLGLSFPGDVQTQQRASVAIPNDALVVMGGPVITGTGEAPIPNGIVVIQGERILTVGPAADYTVPQGVSIVDARGGSIMPGLINSHIHHGAPPELRHRFLVGGVTTVCDLGSALDEIPQFLEEDCSDGPAARGLRAGPIVTAPGGYPDGLYGTHINYEVARPDDAPGAITDLVERGVDMVKIAIDPSWNVEQPLPILELDVVRAIVREAHAHGRLVRAHVIQPPHLDLAIEGGVDVIEHVGMPRWPSSEEEQKVMASDDPVGVFFDRWAPDYQPRLERMVARGIAMVPTVSALLGGFYTASDPTPRQSWVVDVVLDIIRRFHEAGGTVAVGNDFNDRSMRERKPLLEMEMLLEAGLSPMDVIVAGTRNAARVCGREGDLGTLEPGKLADVIVVDGDPLSDLVGTLGRVVTVVRGGVVAGDLPGN